MKSAERVQGEAGGGGGGGGGSDDVCQSVCWMEEWADDATCSLPEGHDGPHVDTWQGWEW